MGGERFTEQKAAARAKGLAARRALSAPEVARRGGEALRRLIALPFFSRARCVALYAGDPDEVPAERLAEALGARAVFARVVKGERVLSFRRVLPAQLVKGPLGIRQPAADSPEVALGEIDLFVVPGAAFTREGARVGRGGGYYDATLAAARPGALRVGVCFDCQLVEALPLEAWDLKVDWVVTESAAIDAQAAARASAAR